jgi:ATP-dependent helicase/nuclease subunit B
MIILNDACGTDVMETVPSGLLTIPSGLGFSTHLAKVLRRLTPQELTKTTIFWPYQRALKDFSNCLCTLSKGATWLPQMFTLKNMDLALNYFGCPPPKTMPISHIERLGLLAQLIAQKPIIVNGTAQTYTFDMALTLANDLSNMLDAADLEGASLRSLKDLVPERFSHHWQITLQFLNILSDTWPELLKSKGYLSPVDALIRSTDALIAHFESQKPEGPVMIVGSTGSVPHVRRLMKAVLTLPKGAVVLPGFEPNLDINLCAAATHPQQTMHTLLEKLGKKPSDVRIWPSKASIKNKARRALLAQTFDPSLNATFDVDALSGISLLEADHEQEEALAIAHLIGRALNGDSHSSVVACIPDATVSRWVKMHLERWGIDADESATTPLAAQPLARLASICLKYAYTPGDMVALLDILKHPAVAPSVRTRHKERLIAQLETDLLRSGSPCLDRAMLSQRIQASPTGERFDCIMRFIDHALAPLYSEEPSQTLDHWCSALLNVLNILTNNNLTHALTDTLEALIKASEAYPCLNHSQFSALLAHVFKKPVSPPCLLVQGAPFGHS